MASRSKQQSLPGLENEDTPVGRKTSRPKPKSPEPTSPPVGPACAPSTRAMSSHDGDQPCPPHPEAVDIKGWNVYVVDSHSLIFQVFHALPEMSSPRGEQVGAVFGFVRDMLYLIEDKKPNALICAFDPPGPTFRDELFEAYKGERSEMPAELHAQVTNVYRL